MIAAATITMIMNPNCNCDYYVNYNYDYSSAIDVRGHKRRRDGNNTIGQSASRRIGRTCNGIADEIGQLRVVINDTISYIIALQVLRLACYVSVAATATSTLSACSILAYIEFRINYIEMIGLLLAPHHTEFMSYSSQSKCRRVGYRVCWHLIT